MVWVQSLDDTCRVDAGDLFPGLVPSEFPAVANYFNNGQPAFARLEDGVVWLLRNRTTGGGGGGGGGGLTPAQEAMLEAALPAPKDTATGGYARLLGAGETFQINTASFLAFGDGAGLTGEQGAGARNFLKGNWTLGSATGAYADYKAFAASDDSAVVNVKLMNEAIADAIDTDTFEVMVADLNKIISLTTAYNNNGHTPITEVDSIWYGRVMYDEIYAAPGVYRRWECCVSRQGNGALVWRWFAING